MGGSGSYSIGPGIWAFVAFFVMAIGLWLLVRNMNGRLRRMAYEERDGSEVGTDGADATAAGSRGAARGPTSLVRPREPGAVDASKEADEPAGPDGPDERDETVDPPTKRQG